MCVKVLLICESWCIFYVDSLFSFVVSCDAVFVYFSIVSYFDVVSMLFNVGVYVCVDKSLVENLCDVEWLVELAAWKKLMLMVGFNCRFVLFYGELKM